jgi:AcrR family transcriptional regulator
MYKGEIPMLSAHTFMKTQGTRTTRPRRRSIRPHSILAKASRNRSAKQEALLAAAARLFAQQGYEGTTTRDIASCAGCAEGLIHRYFRGKAGLLLAIIEHRVSAEVEDLSQRLPVASSFEEEIVNLMEWELNCIWQDRDFLRVIIPRALLDPEVGKALGRVGTSRHCGVIIKRLRKFSQCKKKSDAELESVARFISVAGFGFAFLRPVILGQNRFHSRKLAVIVAKLLASGV